MSFSIISRSHRGRREGDKGGREGGTGEGCITKRDITDARIYSNRGNARIRRDVLWTLDVESGALQSRVS